jgi:hypothetical protein
MSAVDFVYVVITVIRTKAKNVSGGVTPPPPLNNTNPFPADSGLHGDIYVTLLVPRRLFIPALQ